MEALYVEVHPELDEQGSCLPVAGVLELAEYNYGDEVLATPEGVRYDLTLTNTGEGVLVAGSVQAQVQGTCARCLEPANAQVSADVEGYFLFEEAEELEGYANDEFDCVDAEGRIDLAGPLEGALVYGTPFIMLCSEECKGLCPRCGANLNEGPCGCEQLADEPDPGNPFAALKDFDFGDGSASGGQ